MRTHSILIKWAARGIAAVCVLAGLAGSAPLHPARVAASADQQLHPCGVQAKRTIEPRAVEEGGVFNVKVNYDYDCTNKAKRINLILLVETTIDARNIADRNGLLRSLKDGLSSFVHTTDFANGTTGGLTLVGVDYTYRVPLRGDRDGRDALLQAIEGISLKPISGPVGLGAALVDAVGRLPTGVAGAGESWVIIFDRGAPEFVNNQQPPVTIVDGCNRAVTAGVNIAVVSHEQAPDRFPCVTRGYARRSSGPSAPDLPTIFGELGKSIVSGPQATETVYRDYVHNDTFSYVDGSGRPRPPDDLRGNPPDDISWNNLDSLKPAGGHIIEYQLKTETNVPKPVIKISTTLFPTIKFIWADGNVSDYTLDDPENNPEVCIYRKGKYREDCQALGLPLTPTPTPTTPPTDVPTDTPGPITAVPPTATPADTRAAAWLPRVFMPALLAQGGFDGPWRGARE